MTEAEFIKSYTRKFVCDHLHYNGKLIKLLTDEQQWEAYCIADGFGKMTPAQLKTINDGWDWSHVRDSSDKAFSEMAQYIITAANWAFVSIEFAAKVRFDQLEKIGVTPEQYLS